MKRNVIIASLAAAGVVGGAVIAGSAIADDQDDRPRPLNAGSSADLSADDQPAKGKDDDSDESGHKGSSTSWVSAEQAVERALKEAPGVAYGLELEDDDRAWEVDILTRDGENRQIDIARKGGDVLENVLENDRDDDDDDDRREGERLKSALNGASVNLADAARIANEKVPGTIEEIELNDRGKAWKVEFEDVDGRDDDDLELRIDVNSGKATLLDDDDDRDDRDDD